MSDREYSSILEGKIAVVTGASSGIGKSIALALAKMRVKLYLLGRDLKKLNSVAKIAKQDSPLAEPYAVDLTRDNDILNLVNKLEKIYKTADILIHSAGVIYTGKLELATAEEFDTQYKVNVRAPFLLTKLLLPMLRAVKGQIVFINSTAGLKIGNNNGQYAATKSALKFIADSFREELNKDGIRVLSVYPGRTATPMQKALLGRKKYKPAHLLLPEDVSATVINSLIMPRSSEITDISIRPLSKLS